MQKLILAFNPAAVAGLMYRNTLSVDWTGKLFDCDFKQMLELPVSSNLPQKISDFTPDKFIGREITIAAHCFGYTAGAGSSGGGTVA